MRTAAWVKPDARAQFIGDRLATGFDTIDRACSTGGPLEPVLHGPCIAVVEWGTGSGTAMAEVDLAKGDHHPGRWLIFWKWPGRNDGADSDGSRGIDGELQPIDSKADDQDVVVIVSGYGPRPATGRATRTFHFGPIRAGDSRTVVVPNFARSFLITRSPTATTSVALEVSDGSETSAVREGGTSSPGSPPTESSCSA